MGRRVREDINWRIVSSIDLYILLYSICSVGRSINQSPPYKPPSPDPPLLFSPSFPLPSCHFPPFPPNNPKSSIFTDAHHYQISKTLFGEGKRGRNLCSRGVGFRRGREDVFWKGRGFGIGGGEMENSGSLGGGGEGGCGGRVWLVLMVGVEGRVLCRGSVWNSWVWGFGRLVFVRCVVIRSRWLLRKLGILSPGS